MTEENNEALERTSGDVTTTNEESYGSFVESLERKNNKIKLDRAKAIAQDAEFTFKRDVEDIKNRIRKLTRNREDMLDLSGTNAFSTMPTASDFKDAAFSKEYRAFGKELHNLNIEFELAKADYEFLFGREFS